MNLFGLDGKIPDSSFKGQLLIVNEGGRAVIIFCQNIRFRLLLELKHKKEGFKIRS